MKLTPAIGYFVSSVVYLLASYLLLIRDGNFITRLASALNTPQLIEQNTRLVTQIDQRLIHPNTLSLLLLLLSLGGMIWFYLKITTSKIHKNQNLFFVSSLLVVLFSFPSLSTDVFDYHATNKVVFTHHTNPWITPPDQFLNSDSVINLGSWIQRPTVYPPLAIFINSIVYLSFGDNPLLAVIGFKLLALVFYGAIIWLVGRIAHKHGFSVPKSRLLFALNPLILVEFIGNAHNDLPMIFFFLLSFSLLISKKTLLAGVVYALAILSKITIIICLPVICWYLITKTKIQYLTKYLTSLIVASILGFAPIWPSIGEYFHTLQDQNQTFLQSFPYLIKILIVNLFEKNTPLTFLITIIPLLIFGFVYIKSLTQKTYIADKLSLIMLAFLLLQITMLHPWYFSWIVVLIPFIKNQKTQWISLVATFSALIRYPVYNLSLYYSPLHPSWQIAIYLSIFTPILIMTLIPTRWYTDTRFFRILSCKNS